MSFAALETRLAAAVIARIGNITLTDGVDGFPADLRRGVEFVGEFGLTGERRDRITVHKADATWFANGLSIQADPLTYSPAELLAMERTSWYLDRVADDDGQLVSWWLK
jgi:hypothetical protein